MTTQEIKDLVAAKIAGQGNQVDIAGALPVILGEIVDALAGIPPFVIVEEDLVNGAVEITEEQYQKYQPAGILLYKGSKFLLCSNLIDEQFFTAYPWDDVEIFANSIIFDSDGEISAYTAIAIGLQGEKFYITEIEL